VIFVNERADRSRAIAFVGPNAVTTAQHLNRFNERDAVEIRPDVPRNGVGPRLLVSLMLAGNHYQIVDLRSRL
jgi:hypothetical protein